MNKDPLTIGVIGGGITGLMAALELSALGHRVTVFERSQDLGGLAGGFQTHGTWLEKGYHHLFRTDSDILHLVSQLGLEEDLLWHKGSIGAYEGEVLYPFSTPLDLLRFSPFSFIDRIRTGLVILYLQKTRHWEKFIAESAEHWLRRWGGEAAYRVLWEPLLRGKFHAFHTQVSMAWLWARIHTRANSQELGYFRGGFHTLVQALERTLIQRGCHIHCGVSIESIQPRGPDEGVTLRVGNQEHVFDRVVCTVPSDVFARLIPEHIPLPLGYRERLLSIQYLGALCCVFSTPQSLSPYYWINVHEPSMPFLVCIQHTNLVGSAPYGGEHLYYVGTYLPHDHPLFIGDSDSVLRIFFESLRAMIPAFNPSRVTERHLFRLRNAQHVVDTGYPRKIPDYTTPLSDVYLANFSQIFPEDRGTNYAVREGKKVARLICETRE